MGAITYYDPDRYGMVRGSSFGEPDGTEHLVELMEGNGHMILRVQIGDSEDPTELLFTAEQAIAFYDAAAAVLRRLGLDNPHRNG